MDRKRQSCNTSMQTCIQIIPILITKIQIMIDIILLILTTKNPEIKLDACASLAFSQNASIEETWYIVSDVYPLICDVQETYKYIQQTESTRRYK